MSINIKKINIIVETNIENEAPFSLTYYKIYNPVKSRVIKSQTKLDYPYFTPDVEYNEELFSILFIFSKYLSSYFICGFVYDLSSFIFSVIIKYFWFSIYDIILLYKKNINEIDDVENKIK